MFNLTGQLEKECSSRQVCDLFSALSVFKKNLIICMLFFLLLLSSAGKSSQFCLLILTATQGDEKYELEGLSATKRSKLFFWYLYCSSNM